MTFQPIVPFGGFNGWQFLNRTLDAQKTAFNASPQINREVAYFKENIGEISTAEELVADRTLLSVALGAFGLDEDLDNRFFIRKILEDGTSDPEALGNKLADRRYREFAGAFGFGDGGVPATLTPGFADQTTQDYLARQFEIAVGAQDDDLRLAFAVDRDLADLAQEATSDNAKWFSIMGNPPLRSAFETALGLPSSFVTLDLDAQLKEFRQRLDRATGDGEISQFSDPEKLDDFVRLFLLRADLASGPSASTPGASALTLLTPQGSAANILQIVASR
ncbi:DUF1217 domain-containing protein [Actibacterium sp. 188UL27-1]|uniref:DUF1217 domain-containing protein n=1 Tax=Actibacterium sp. 188UL27-1 TaxID=2786961 RepID=UPI0019565B33|nr:DUF1217 domain-containing protein [Actibacterium sp. 188UL27-1]MBM7069892.1 DUF1217 domain-containing protein [Actibacterium sp. 188UL27-1]